MLLQDEILASRVDWMKDKSRDGAEKEAFRIELLCNAGQLNVWSIVERARQMQIDTSVGTRPYRRWRRDFARERP